MTSTLGGSLELEKMDDLSEIARSCKNHDEALVVLHEANASPVCALKAMMDGRGVSLSDAKAMLMNSPAWFQEAKNANHLHGQIEEALNETEML